jgi:hypothetical protein
MAMPTALADLAVAFANPERPAGVATHFSSTANGFVSGFEGGTVAAYVGIVSARFAV